MKGRPDIFRPGFCQELKDVVYGMWQDEDKDIIVAERDGVICGFACVEYIERPQSPYNLERKFYHVSEFGVDTAFRRQKVATELFAFMREHARKKGFGRIELDMWEFNEGALKFYESVGFCTIRRYMECSLE